MTRNVRSTTANDGGDDAGFAYLKPSKPSPSQLDYAWLLKGEKIAKELIEENIGYLSPPAGRKIIGNVYVTNYRLRFEANCEVTKGNGIVRRCIINVALGSVARVEKIGGRRSARGGEDTYGLEIHCKDMRNIRFVSDPQFESRRNLFAGLQKVAFPKSNDADFFAVDNRESYPVDGWTIFSAVAEYKRMGVPNDAWKLTKINDKYQYADTYPCELVIPAAAEMDTDRDAFMHAVGKFRSKQRIPVLCWLHPHTQASITRCAQPMTGVTSRHCAEDVRYLHMIIDANAHAHQLCIMDARPEVNAKVNRAKGGGYETEEAYPNCPLTFLDIQNIHVMRESQRKLKELCFPLVDDRTWLSRLDETHWLQHIRLIMCAGVRIVDQIERHQTSVLVHCSDGWDRTAQLTSLAMIMLDPYYRTVVGLAVLVEKEWCAFGHKFAHRVGHGCDKHADSERSPVFLQFIDCVYQLQEQFPNVFEYNSQMLTALFDEVYSCRFGTFLYNTEKQRVAADLRKRTPSVWSMFFKDSRNVRDVFRNPKYV